MLGFYTPLFWLMLEDSESPESAASSSALRMTMVATGPLVMMSNNESSNGAATVVAEGWARALGLSAGLESSSFGMAGLLCTSQIWNTGSGGSGGAVPRTAGAERGS